MTKYVYRILVFFFFIVDRALFADVQSKFCSSPGGETLLLAEPSQKFKHWFWRNGIQHVEDGQFKIKPPNRLEFPNGTELSKMGAPARSNNGRTIIFTFTNRYTQDTTTVVFNKSTCVSFP